MTTLIALAALVFVAAITPGPNNLAVLNAASDRGPAGAVYAIVGVLLGSLALLAIALCGAGPLFAAQPRLRDGVSVIGCGYLAWLGARMTARSLWRPRRDTDVVMPTGIIPLASFQFVNPKSWTMVLTAAAAARAAMDPAAAAVLLVALFLTIPAVCLTAWAWLGLQVLPRLQQHATRVWFDGLTGGLLLGSAIVLGMDMMRRSMPQ